MTAKALLKQGALQFDQQPSQVQHVFSRHLFTSGAQWMFGKLPETESETAGRFNVATPFGLYGCYKYGISLLTFVGSFLALEKVSMLLTPLAVLFFYVVEVHFLFLFPLLLDRAKNPILTSMRATYRIGFLRALFGVLTIGVYMLSGLLNRHNPLRRWHIGCLSVILWYQYEVRNRLQS